MPGACSHGADEHLSAAPTRWTGDTAATSSSRASRPDYLALRCGSADGNRIEVLYAHPKGRGRLAQVRNDLDEAVGVANGIVYRSSQQTSGQRQLAVLTTPSGGSCKLAVTDVTVSDAALNDLNKLIGELQSLRFTREDRKYLVFGDGTNSLCGIATLYQDDRATPMNLNNIGGSIALAGNGQGCWDGFVVAHELLHTLGAVQGSAAHATDGGHCNDGADVMCYDDGTARSRQRALCPPANGTRLDCNHDDYFSTSARAGSYLATHWNTANSSFLYGGGPAAPVPPGSPANLTADVAASQDGSSGSDVALTWKSASGRVTAYALTLPDGSTVHLAENARSYTDRNVSLAHETTYSLTAANEAGPGSAATVTVPARQSSRLPIIVPFP